MKSTRVPLTVLCPVCGAREVVMPGGKIKSHEKAAHKSLAVLPGKTVVNIFVRCSGSWARVVAQR